MAARSARRQRGGGGGVWGSREGGRGVVPPHPPIGDAWLELYYSAYSLNCKVSKMHKSITSEKFQ